MRLVLSSLVVLSLLPVPQQQQPTFRAGTSLVPVNVRVIDDHGSPVTNLRQEDFSVFEDGALQPIRLFDAHALTPAASGAVRQSDAAAAMRVLPQERRVFLIVLGRGRLNQVSNGIDAAVAFVGQRLLPQDLVAVLAWNRATAFTTDRAFILEVLHRFARTHEDVDQKIREWFSGLRASYVPATIPDFIQAEIDPIFAGGPAAGTSLMTAVSHDETPATDRPPGETFDQFIQTEIKSNQDLDKITAGVEYLRGVDGEKHLVFVTDAGIVGGSADPERDLATRASDARVAIDYVQTGGIMPTGPIVMRPGGPIDGRLVTQSGFALAALERSAALTGGTGSMLSQAASGFDAIDRATRFEYLIGYEPANKTTTPFVRHIEVKVHRTGVTVIARRSYFATPVKTLTGRALAAYTTILREVGEQTLPSNVAKHTTDFPMSASALDIVDEEGPGVDVKIDVDASRFAFLTPKGRNVVASLDIAIFARKGTLRTTSWHTVDLGAPGESAGGKPVPVSFTIRAHTVPKPEEVMVVVYEYGPEIVSFAYARKSGR